MCGPGDSRGGRKALGSVPLCAGGKEGLGGVWVGS